jgi:drug/metabolite transporter (DMT)-like permease
MHPLQFEVVSNLMHLALSLAAVAAVGIKYQPMSAPTLGIAFAQVVMGFITVLAFTFAISSGNNLGASTSIMSASPVVTLALSMLIYGEKLDLKTAIGILMVIVGTAIVSSR